MVTGSVGMTIFIQLPPNWKANTIVWRVMPIKSASGAKMGIVSTALPEPEGIKKSMTVCSIIAAHEAHTGCSLLMPADIQLSIVSKIWPLLAIITIACAKHKSIAISAIPRTPSKKASVNFCMLILPKKPHTNPTPKNSAAISVIYQPLASRSSISIRSMPHMPLIMLHSCGLSTPAISVSIPSPKAINTHFWRRVMRVSSLLSFNSLRFSISNS